MEHFHVGDLAAQHRPMHLSLAAGETEISEAGRVAVDTETPGTLPRQGHRHAYRWWDHQRVHVLRWERSSHRHQP